MFAFFESRGPVDVAFTDRHGGVSHGPTASLNLGVAGGDDRDTVRNNIGIVAHALARGGQVRADDPFALPPGVSPPAVATMRQVHGCAVAVVEAPLPASYGDGPRADALVTRAPGVALLARVADCVPVVLADLDGPLVAVVHSGRNGLLAGVTTAAVATLRTLGAGRLQAWIGPHVCGGCYEVPDALRSEVSAVVPAAYASTSWGTPSLDLGRGVVSQLAACGVDQVYEVGRCTMEDQDLFSHRRQDGKAGRMAGLVWIRP